MGYNLCAIAGMVLSRKEETHTVGESQAETEPKNILKLVHTRRRSFGWRIWQLMWQFLSTT